MLTSICLRILFISPWRFERDSITGHMFLCPGDFSKWKLSRVGVSVRGSSPSPWTFVLSPGLFKGNPQDPYRGLRKDVAVTPMGSRFGW